jgi:hypothetical protein
MSVHEDDARLSLDNLVPLRRLESILQRVRTVYLVQPVPNKWNVVIGEVRHEEQIFPSSTL